MRFRGIISFATLATALLVLVSAVSAPTLASPSSDAHRALNRVLPDLNLTGVTINDAIEFLRDIAGTNLHVNWPALEAVGVSKETPVNIRLRNVSLRKVLTLVLNESSAGVALTFYVDDGVIEVTTRELADKQLITRLYPIEDLIMDVPDFIGPDINLDSGNGGGGRGGGGGGGGSIVSNGNTNKDQKNATREERTQALIDMITSIIEPDVWQVNGGTAAIRFFNGSLIVTAPRSVHEALGGPTD